MLYCSINGQQTDQLSIADRGLAYGDGIFTTAKIHHGQVEMLEQHIKRLKSSCQRLGIEGLNFNRLKEELSQLALTYPLAVLKVLISAGQGGRGYSRIGVNTPTVIISSFDFPLFYVKWQQQGIWVGDSQTQLGINPLLAGIKHLNRLEQVFVRKELDSRVEDDLLVYNINNRLVESSSSNVFWFKGQELYTPKITDAGVAGLMRDAVLKHKPKTKQVKCNIS